MVVVVVRRVSCDLRDAFTVRNFHRSALQNVQNRSLGHEAEPFCGRCLNMFTATKRVNGAVLAIRVLNATYDRKSSSSSTNFMATPDIQTMIAGPCPVCYWWWVGVPKYRAYATEYRYDLWSSDITRCSHGRQAFLITKTRVLENTIPFRSSTSKTWTLANRLLFRPTDNETCQTREYQETDTKMKWHWQTISSDAVWSSLAEKSPHQTSEPGAWP